MFLLDALEEADDDELESDADVREDVDEAWPDADSDDWDDLADEEE